MQINDPKLSYIIERLREIGKNDDDNELKQFKNDYELYNGSLFRKVDGDRKWVVPGGLKWRIARTYHDERGHLAEEKTLSQIKKLYWFPRMRQYIKKFIKSCIECCYNKQKGGKSEGELHVMETLPIPFHTINVDHLGPFPSSSTGNKYVIAICDSFTKFTLLRATRNTKTSPVVKLLNEMSSYFGVPSRLITDRGTSYTSRAFQSYAKKHSIKHIKIAVRAPQANGQVERVNRTILPAIKSMCDQSGKFWDKNLSAIQWTLNSTASKTTRKSPHELIFNFSPRDILGNHLILALHDGNDNLVNDLELSQKDAVNRIMEEKMKWKKRYDLRHRKFDKYEVDDLVVIENEPSAQGESRKLEPKYKGPYRISKVLPNDRYVVEDLEGKQRNQRFFSSIFDASKIKAWCENFPEFDDDICNDSNDEDSSCDEIGTGTFQDQDGRL